jgi:hypothetical protein
MLPTALVLYGGGAGSFIKTLDILNGREILPFGRTPFLQAGKI